MTAEPPRPYRRIACEEGFLSPAVLAQNARETAAGTPLITADGPASDLAKALVDIGPDRIALMDQARVDVQLLLLASPGVQEFDAATAVSLSADANDWVAEGCSKYPTRLSALTTIAPQDPAAAAKEMERGMTRLGMKGALINSHTADEYLDQAKFWPIFEAAEALDGPIYIHPRDPPSGMREIMSGPVAGGPAWAYGVEVGTHVLRLISAGVFDRFPKLRIVIGHMGEALPFWLSRIDNRYLAMRGAMFGGAKPMQRMPSDYIRDNIWITTSGMNGWPQLQMTLEVLSPERVLFAADYPFEDQGEAVLSVEAMPLSIDQKQTLFEDNAARLFRL